MMSGFCHVCVSAYLYEGGTTYQKMDMIHVLFCDLHFANITEIGRLPFQTGRGVLQRANRRVPLESGLHGLWLLDHFCAQT